MISNQVYFYGNPIYDMYNKLKELNFETFKNSIKDINLDNRSVVILDNKTQEARVICFLSFILLNLVNSFSIWLNFSFSILKVYIILV